MIFHNYGPIKYYLKVFTQEFLMYVLNPPSPLSTLLLPIRVSGQHFTIGNGSNVKGFQSDLRNASHKKIRLLYEK